MKFNFPNKKYIFFLLLIFLLTLIVFFNNYKWEKRYNLLANENEKLKHDILNNNERFNNLSSIEHYNSNNRAECDKERKVLKNRENTLKIEAEKNSSYKLMLELLAQQNLEYSDYKIFEEIKSPNSKNIAVLYGLNTEECCSEPTAIFINNNGTLYKENFALVGALQHLFLNNVRWQNNSSVFFDDNVIDERGTFTLSTKNIKIK